MIIRRRSAIWSATARAGCRRIWRPWAARAHQQMAGYLGMIKRLDEALGRLVDALISLDMLDDTIILFTSDHGCHFKTRNAEYKRSCHDASVRVPTMFHGGPFAGGGRLPQMVSLLDLPPTLLDAAGIPVPAQMQGTLDPAAADRRRCRLAGRGLHSDQRVASGPSDPQPALEIRRDRARCKDGWDDMNSDVYVESELYDSAGRPQRTAQPRRLRIPPRSGGRAALALDTAHGRSGRARAHY